MGLLGKNKLVMIIWLYKRKVPLMMMTNEPLKLTFLGNALWNEFLGHSKISTTTTTTIIPADSDKTQKIWRKLLGLVFKTFFMYFSWFQFPQKMKNKKNKKICNNEKEITKENFVLVLWGPPLPQTSCPQWSVTTYFYSFIEMYQNDYPFNHYFPIHTLLITAIFSHH